jgi:CRISPR/Cas system CSM-associated protein Csm3 (group 7 of RAMP superfamily)
MGSKTKRGKPGRDQASKRPERPTKPAATAQAEAAAAPSAEAASAPRLPRARIEGLLRLKSPLHIGSGDTAAWRQDDLPAERERPELDTAPDYHTCCLLPGRGPYLPASSLRGALRARLHGAGAADALRRRLFGEVPPSPADGQASAGCLRLRDAFIDADASLPDYRALADTPAAGNSTRCPPDNKTPALPPYWMQGRGTALRQGIARDPRLGTAMDERLYSHERVPAGVAFRIVMDLIDATRDELRGLLALLRGWDGSLAGALGARTGKGWGRVAWEPTDVLTLDEATFRRWLAEDDPTGRLDDCLTPDPALLAQAQGRAANATAPAPPPGVLALDLKLTPRGPILVNEPGWRPADGADDEHTPTHYFSRDPADGTPLLPGTSLVGLLRARARRILCTMAAGILETAADGASPAAPTDLLAEQAAEALLGRLFGSAERRGALWLGDARAEGKLRAADHDLPDADPPPAGAEAQHVKCHEQTFIAIDRFTGGTRSIRGQGALFSVQGTVDGSFRAPLLLETARLARQEAGGTPHWWQGLLLLVARDALEGDLSLGWGQGRGWGAVAFRLDPAGAKAGSTTANLAHATGRMADGDSNAWPQVLEHLRTLTGGEPRAWLEQLEQAIRTELDPRAGRTPAAPEQRIGAAQPSTAEQPQ